MAKTKAKRTTETMSVKKTLSLNHGEAVKGGTRTKSVKFSRFFSCKQISMEAGKTLEQMDSNKLKSEIQRWAKAVVAYARQVSARFGSSHG